MMEKLNDNDLSDEELEKEIKRSKQMVEVGKAIIDNGSLALAAQKHLDEYGGGKINNPLLGIKTK